MGLCGNFAETCGSVTSPTPTSSEVLVVRRKVLLMLVLLRKTKFAAEGLVNVEV